MTELVNRYYCNCRFFCDRPKETWVHTVIFGVLALNTSNSIKCTTVIVDIFGINWLNCEIDTTVNVDVFEIN